jgi:predicted histidine transporter YuiF (NhaC family)
LLCCIPPLVCAFSFSVLKKIQPQNPNNNFILYSALLMLGFLVNEIYRVHIILVYFGIPKLVTIFIYATIAFSYGKAFRKRIKSTPYILLLVSLGLLFIAITVDSLRINNISNFAEGIPKLFSGINAALYFWLVCYKEVIYSLSKKTI